MNLIYCMTPACQSSGHSRLLQKSPSGCQSAKPTITGLMTWLPGSEADVYRVDDLAASCRAKFYRFDDVSSHTDQQLRRYVACESEAGCALVGCVCWWWGGGGGGYRCAHAHTLRHVPFVDSPWRMYEVRYMCFGSPYPSWWSIVAAHQLLSSIVSDYLAFLGGCLQWQRV